MIKRADKKPTAAAVLKLLAEIGIVIILALAGAWTGAKMGVTLTDQGDLLWKSIALSLAGCSTGFFMGLGTVGLLRERTASTPEDDPQKIGEQE